MKKDKFKLALLVSMVAMLSGGCVSSGTYQAKERESMLLKKSLEETSAGMNELQEKNNKLKDENEKLKDENGSISLKLKKLESEMSVLKIENEKLTEDVKPENLLKTLVNSYNAVQAENLKLKQALSVAEKVSQKKAPEPPVKLDPIISMPVTRPDKGAVEEVKEPSGSNGETPDSSLNESSEEPVDQKVEEGKQSVEKLQLKDL